MQLDVSTQYGTRLFSRMPSLASVPGTMFDYYAAANKDDWRISNVPFFISC